MAAASAGGEVPRAATNVTIPLGSSGRRAITSRAIADAATCASLTAALTATPACPAAAASAMGHGALIRLCSVMITDEARSTGNADKRPCLCATAPVAAVPRRLTSTLGSRADTKGCAAAQRGGERGGRRRRRGGRGRGESGRGERAPLPSGARRGMVGHQGLAVGLGPQHGSGQQAAQLTPIKLRRLLPRPADGH